MDNTTEDCASLAHVRADSYQALKEFIEQRYTNMQARKVDLAEKADKMLNTIEACPEDGWYIDGLGQDQNDLSAMKGKGKGYGKGKSGGGKQKNKGNWRRKGGGASSATAYQFTVQGVESKVDACVLRLQSLVSDAQEALEHRNSLKLTNCTCL